MSRHVHLGQNHARSLVESCVATMLVGLLLVAVKLYLVRVGVTFRWDSFFTLRYYDHSYLIYALWSPVQEFLFRGLLQRRLQARWANAGHGWMAIFVTSIVFSAMHVHLSFSMVALTFALGLLWGWLYHRHGSILGISISHFVLGDFAGFLGLWDYFIKS